MVQHLLCLHTLCSVKITLPARILLYIFMAAARPPHLHACCEKGSEKQPA
jgi:hypothetical protein